MKRFHVTQILISTLWAASPHVSADPLHSADDELAAAAAALAPPFDPARDAITIEKLNAQKANSTGLTPVGKTLALKTQAALTVPTGPATQGTWSSVIPWTPHIPVTAAILPNGNLLTFASNQRTSFPSGPEFTYAAVWDPATGQFVEVNNNRHDMFCGGTALLPDGRLVVNGGRATTRLSSIFDWSANKWQALPDMNDPRWYNPSVAMPDGSVFTVSGSGGSNTAELWNEATGWRRLSGIGWSAVTSEPGYINIWHPFLMLAPNGNLFHFGPTDRMNWVTTQGTGSLTYSGNNIPGTHYPKEGAWAMYNEGRIVVAGGGATTTSGSDSTTGTSTTASYKVDLRGSSPAVSSITPMTIGRQFANSVVLPNGEVMVIGGNGGVKFSDAASVLTPEIWSPTTETWRTTANHAVPRNYHSVALLLPDGRVWSAGGGLGGGDHRDAEIFTPPNLYDASGALATRPVISSMPAKVGVGSSFTVNATAGLSRFTMIRLSAVTHSVNTDQRFLEASFTQTSSGVYRINTNTNVNVFLPGYWMLFGINSAGVHSVSKIFQVERAINVAVTNPGSQSGYSGEVVSLPLTAQSSPGASLAFSATGLPTGLSISPSTGIITGTPSVNGSFNASVSVTDGITSSTQNFTWTIAPQTRSHQFPGFTSATGLTLNGNSAVASSRLRLTQASTTGIYQPGLWYGTVAGNINTTSANPRSLVTVDLSQTKDGIAADTTEIYTGQIYDADGRISFTENIDDFTRLYIDGALVLSSDNWSDRVSTGNLNLAPGWHEFELRISNGGGGSGPVSSPGFGFDPNGGTAWVHPSDPGNGSLFRSPLAGSTAFTQASSAWLSQPFPVRANTSFVSRFVFRQSGTGDGGEGLTFTVQGNSASALGTDGNSIGYGGINSSLAVEFDSYIGTNDPNANHIAVLANGDVATHLTTHTPSFDMEDGLDHTAWVEYDGTTNTLRVYLSQTITNTRPGTPVIALNNIDLASLVGQQAWFGFTAANGRASNAHEISSWDMAMDANKLPSLSLPPVLTNPGAITSITGTAVSRQIVATDPENDPLTFSASNLPPGLSISAGGLITGTPTTPGTQTVDLTATDDSNPSVRISFQWTVNAPFTLSPLAGGALASGASQTFTVTSSGGINLRYKWNFGDGTPETAFSSSPDATHTFANPGRYLVTVTVTDDTGRILTSSFYQGISAPPTTRAPSASSSIIVERRSTGNHRVWVVNPDTDTVAVLDAVTRAKLVEIPVAASPRTLAVAPDGRIWVACSKGGAVSIVSPSTLTIVQSLALPRGSRPFGIAFDPAGSVAWLTLEATGRLLKLNPATGAVLADTAVGPDPRHLSVSHDGARVLVSRFITPPLPGENTATINTTGRGGEIVVVNGNTAAIDRTVILRHSDAPDTSISGRGIPNYLGAPVITPDGLSAWIPSKQDNILRGSLRDGKALTHDSAVRPIASRVNLSTLTEDYPARIDFNDAGTPTAVCHDPSGILTFVALEGSRSVAVLDTWNHVEITRFDVGRAPQGLVLSADGNTLFIQNFMDRSVTVRDVSGIRNGGNAAPALLGNVSTVSVETLPANILLGKKHFYDTKDNRLALQEYISCASCHADAGHDGRVWDFTGFGEGLRNTITLRGHANQGALHWTGNFDEVHDFEGQIRNFAGGTGLIANGTPNLPLGASNAGRSADLDALATYVKSLTLMGDSPARPTAGTLPAAATAGRTVFKTQNCASCHSGPEFTNSALGVFRDVGTIKATTGKRLNGTLPGLDVPTLRGLWATAPYLHDGSATTIGDAVSAHSGVSLNPSDLSNLVAYLSNLDDSAATAPGQFNVQLTTSGTTFSTPFPVTATFSSTAGNFTLSDIIVTNGTASALTGTGVSRSFTVTPTQFGSVTISIPAGAATDVDGDGNIASNVLTIAVPNRPPSVATPVAQSSVRGSGASLQISASDPDGQPLVISATGLPPGLTIASGTGLISGIPTTIGTYPSNVTVTTSLAASSTVSFTWNVVPAVFTTFSESFATAGLDSSRWSIGSTYGEIFAPVDPLIGVVQQNGRLEITPRTNTAVEGYRGIVSRDLIDLRGASVTVDVTPAGGTADSWLALGTGVGNFLVIGREGSVLWLEQMTNGGRDLTLFDFDAAAHRKWRIRHESTTDRILFQLSADGSTWITARTISRGIDISAMRIELACGSFRVEPSAGTALFDNLSVAPAGISPVIQSLTASPTELTTGGSSTLSWSVNPGSSPLTALTLNSANLLNSTSMTVSPTATTTYTLVATTAVSTTTATVTVTVRPPVTGNTYAEWAAAFGGTGNPTADVDGDSYAEGLEYALGLDPSSGSTTRSTLNGANPNISRAVRMERSVATDGGRRFDLVFTRPKVPLPDIGYGYWLEVSSDMETWGISANLNGAGTSSIPDILQIIVTDLGDGTEEVRAGFKYLPSLYLRLAVYLPTTTVHSAPFGWMNRSIHYAENLVAPPFARESVYGGKYKWIPDVFTDTSAAWTPGQWAGHFVQITSGAAAGVMLQIQSNTATTLSFDGEPDSLLNLLDTAPSGTYVIRRSHTLASLFGVDNRDALFTGDPAGADVVSFLNPDSSFSDYYFRKPGFGGTGWRSMNDPFADVSARILPPTEALFLRRSDPATTSVHFFGEVILGRRLAPIRAGISLPGTWNAIEKSNLANLGVEPFFSSSTTANYDNNLYLEIGTAGGLYPHYLKTAAGWRFTQDDSTPLGTQVFPAASSWLFYRFGSEALWSRNPAFNYNP